MRFEIRYHVPAFTALVLAGTFLGTACGRSTPSPPPPKNLKAKPCTSSGDCEPEPFCADTHECIEGECAYSRSPGCVCYVGEVRECEVAGVLGFQVCEQNGQTTQWGGCGCPAGSECSPDGVVRCRPTGTPATQTCNGGKWVTRECGAGDICEAGQCICPRDARRCSGEIPQRCIGGDWSGDRPCSDELGGSTCRDGNCVCPNADQSPCNCKGKQVCLTARECANCRP